MGGGTERSSSAKCCKDGEEGRLDPASEGDSDGFGDCLYGNMWANITSGAKIW